MTENFRTFRHRGSPCLNCGEPLDASSGESDRKPQPGDISICLGCGHLMGYADDLTLRPLTDDEIIEVAGDKTLLLYQKARGLTVGERDPRKVPLPERMRHLDRDPRGYPIFAMAYRDETGRAHFTINDSVKRHELLMGDRCSICGTKLFRARWFIGGPASAFHPQGAYIDPPMHDECAHYALRVCPYVATPSYGKGIEGRTLGQDDSVVLGKVHNVGDFQPDVFVAVLARGQKIINKPLTDYIRPTRPYMRIEFWRHGQRLGQGEGMQIAMKAMAQHKLEGV